MKWEGGREGGREEERERGRSERTELEMRSEKRTFFSTSETREVGGEEKERERGRGREVFLFRSSVSYTCSRAQTLLRRVFVCVCACLNVGAPAVSPDTDERNFALQRVCFLGGWWLSEDVDVNEVNGSFHLPCFHAVSGYF